MKKRKRQEIEQIICESDSSDPCGDYITCDARRGSRLKLTIDEGC